MLQLIMRPSRNNRSLALPHGTDDRVIEKVCIIPQSCLLLVDTLHRAEPEAIEGSNGRSNTTDSLEKRQLVLPQP